MQTYTIFLWLAVAGQAASSYFYWVKNNTEVSNRWDGFTLIPLWIAVLILLP